MAAKNWTSPEHHRPLYDPTASPAKNTCFIFVRAPILFYPLLMLSTAAAFRQARLSAKDLLALPQCRADRHVIDKPLARGQFDQEAVSLSICYARTTLGRLGELIDVCGDIFGGNVGRRLDEVQDRCSCRVRKAEIVDETGASDVRRRVGSCREGHEHIQVLLPEERILEVLADVNLWLGKWPDRVTKPFHRKLPIIPARPTSSNIVGPGSRSMRTLTVQTDRRALSSA